MKVKVQAWGNSLGLRIPKAYATELGVGSGSEMEVKVEAGALLAGPQRQSTLRLFLLRSRLRTNTAKLTGVNPAVQSCGESTGARGSDLAQLHTPEWA